MMALAEISFDVKSVFWPCIYRLQ